MVYMVFEQGHRASTINLFDAESDERCDRHRRCPRSFD
jgi:hypothetical protein